VPQEHPRRLARREPARRALELVEQGVRAVAGDAALVDLQRIDRLAGHRLDRPAVQLGDPSARQHSVPG
jgi:hypothetical protein